MAVYNLLSKAQQAVAAYLISAEAGTSADVFAAKRAADIPSEPPFTTVFAESAPEEIIPYSGVYKVKVSVDVHTNAAPDKDQDTETMALDSDARVAATGDALHDLMQQSGDGLGDLITDAAASAGITDFTCQSAMAAGMDQGRSEKDGEWIDTFNLELLCYASGGD